MDDNISAVKVTLDLVINAVEYLVQSQSSFRHEDNQKAFDYVLNHAYGDFEDNLRVIMDSNDASSNLRENDYEGRDDIAGIESTAENVDNYAIPDYDREVKFDSDNWKVICQADDLDYQDDCLKTKGWVSDELHSIKKRADARAKLFEAAKKENFTIKIQAFARGYIIRRHMRRKLFAWTLLRRLLAKYFVCKRAMRLQDSVVSIAEFVLLETMTEFMTEVCHCEVNSRRQIIVANFTAAVQKSNFTEIKDISNHPYRLKVNASYTIDRIGGMGQKLKSGTAKLRRSLTIKRDFPSNQLVNNRLGKMNNKFATASQFAALLNSIEETASSVGIAGSTCECKTISGVVDMFRASERPSDLSSTEALLELDLSVEGISSMFFLEKYPLLEKLALNVNKVSSLDGIEQARHLKFVSLSDNCLREIKEIERLKELVFINLDSNRLEVASLSRMSSLSTLSLSCNQLETICLEDLPKLRRLELYSNKLQTAPFLACDLISLLHLNLGRNQIQTLDGVAISRLVHLQTLILSQNLIREFPTGLHLLCLSALWLNGNKITGCVGGISNMSLPSLKKLYLQDNQISDIEETFPLSTPLLCELDMSFNQLNTLSTVSSMSKWTMLEVVNITDNPISAQRDRPNSVLHLDLISQPYLRFYSGESVTRRDRSTTLQTMRSQNYPRHNRKFIHFAYNMRFAVDMCTTVVKRESVRRKGRRKSSLEDAVEIDSIQLQLLRIQHSMLQSAKENSRKSWNKHIAGLFAKVFIAAPANSVPPANKIASSVDTINNSSCNSISESKQVKTSDTTSEPRAISSEQSNLEVASLVSLEASMPEDTSGSTKVESLDPSAETPLTSQSFPSIRSELNESIPPNPSQINILSDQMLLVPIHRSKELSASQIQRFVRARLRRKQLQRVLRSVHYADCELEEIFDAEDLDLLNTDQWLNADIDSAEIDFSTPIPPSQTEVKSLPAKEDLSASSKTLAYGDHVRKRSLHTDIKPNWNSCDSEEEEDTVLTTKSAPSQNITIAGKDDFIKVDARTNILKDWGIQNDALAATLLKRNKKLKKLKGRDGGKRK